MQNQEEVDKDGKTFYHNEELDKVRSARMFCTVSRSSTHARAPIIL